MRRAALIFVACGLFALGCEGLIGANFDHGAASDGGAEAVDAGDGLGADGSVDGASAADAGKTDGGALADGGGASDGGTFRAACGDMSPYDPGSPWPMGGYCPTRPNRSPAPALTTPHLLWRFDYASLASGLEYGAGPAIAADGTVLVPGYFGFDGSLLYAVSGIKNKVEVFRAPLPGGNCATPTIGKSGVFYVHCAMSLTAFDKSGGRLWSAPLKTSNSSMPVLLGDGTIVVLDGPEMAFIPPNGTGKRVYALGDGGLMPTFYGSIAVSATGVLYAAVAPKPGDLNGSLHAVDSSAQTVAAPVTLTGSPTSSPMFDAEGNVLLTTSGGIYMYSPSLAGAGSTVMARTPSQPHGALTGPAVFFPSDDSTFGPFSYVTATQQLTDFSAETARYTSMVSVGGGLVFARRSSGLSPPVRVESWTLDAGSSWNVPLDTMGADFYGVAVGADGTVYVPHGATLYAIGN